MDQERNWQTMKTTAIAISLGLACAGPVAAQTSGSGSAGQSAQSGQSAQGSASDQSASSGGQSASSGGQTTSLEQRAAGGEDNSNWGWLGLLGLIGLAGLRGRKDDHRYETTTRRPT